MRGGLGQLRARTTWRRGLPWLAGGLAWAALALLAAVLLYYMDEKARLEVAAQARVALDEASDEIDARLETALAVPETLAVVIGARGDDSRYWGLVSLAVDVDELFDDIVQIGRRNDVAIAVRRFDIGKPPGEAFAGDARIFAASPVSKFYPIQGGGRLQLAAGPLGGWGAVASVPAYARVLVHLLAFMVGVMVHNLVAGRLRDRMLASRDALTGLANRQSFDHRLSEAMLRAEPHSCALLLVDLDGFKPVNDTHGHSAGDVVLQEVGERVQQALGHAGTAYRIGGDEFAVLLYGVRHAADVRTLAQRLIERIEQPVVLGSGGEVRIGASIGAAVFPMGGQLERAIDVFNRADRALYRGKGQGGGSAHIEPSAEEGRAGG